MSVKRRSKCTALRYTWPVTKYNHQQTLRYICSNLHPMEVNVLRNYKLFARLILYKREIFLSQRSIIVQLINLYGQNTFLKTKMFFNQVSVESINRILVVTVEYAKKICKKYQKCVEYFLFLNFKTLLQHLPRESEIVTGASYLSLSSTCCWRR